MAYPLRKMPAEPAARDRPLRLCASTALVPPMLDGTTDPKPVAEVPMMTRGSRAWLAGTGLDRMGDGSIFPPVTKAWQFLCLAEITNFVELRRYLGKARADRLMLDVDDRI